MGADRNPARLVRAIPTALAALLAFVLAGTVLHGCGLTEGARHTETATHMAAAPVQQIAPPAGGVQTVVTPSPSAPPAGVEVRLTDAAAIGSMIAALVAIWLALTARHTANGAKRSIDAWRSSPPGQ